MPQSDDSASDVTLNSSDVASDSTDEVDGLFDCLANYQRRAAIQRLSEGSGPMVIEELVQGVAEQVDVNAVGTSREDPKADVAISLIHNHLPRMRDAGVIEVDYETNTVREGDRFETARTLLEMV